MLRKCCIDLKIRIDNDVIVLMVLFYLIIKLRMREEFINLIKNLLI